MIIDMNKWMSGTEKTENLKVTDEFTCNRILRISAESNVPNPALVFWLQRRMKREIWSPP